MRQLDDGIFVSGQVLPDDLPDLAARGIRTIINNRPDGEAPGQPAGDAIQAAAAKAGISYLSIPMAQLTREAIEQSRHAFADAERPILAFCAAGTRSTYLWALAHAGDVAADALEAKAAAAGYDLTPIKRFL